MHAILAIKYHKLVDEDLIPSKLIIIYQMC